MNVKQAQILDPHGGLVFGNDRVIESENTIRTIVSELSKKHDVRTNKNAWI
jgi:hypothetical protein